MISSHFTLKNPWSKVEYEELAYKHGKFSEHKCWELEVYADETLIAASFHVFIKMDHAGSGFSLGLFGYNVVFNFYDTRHWDYLNNKWEESKNGVGDGKN